MTDFVWPKPRERIAQAPSDTAAAANEAQPPTPAVRRALAAAATSGGLAGLKARTVKAQGDVCSHRVAVSDVCNGLMELRKGPPTHAGMSAARPAPDSLLSAAPQPRLAVNDAAAGGGPHDWVSQNAAMQRSLAETNQKAAVATALLKLQTDLNDASVSFIKSIGSSVRAAAQ